MRSHKTYSETMHRRYHLLLAALVVVAVMGCLFNPAAADEELPDENTFLEGIALFHDYSLIAYWIGDDFTRSTVAGLQINKIEATIMVHEKYIPSTPGADRPTSSSVRVHAEITSPDNDLVFVGFITKIEGTAKIGDAWHVLFSQHFDAHLLFKGEFKIIVAYDVLIGDVWTNVDTLTYFLICTPPLPTPDIPTGYDVWLPVMLSFAVIVGMAFIGFNMTRDRSPSPAPVLFMLFVGVVLTWSFGWLPLWIFITAIALLSLASAMLWAKMFKGR